MSIAAETHRPGGKGGQRAAAKRLAMGPLLRRGVRRGIGLGVGSRGEKKKRQPMAANMLNTSVGSHQT